MLVTKKGAIHMKASELREGEEYSYQRGKYSSPRRVTLVEAPVAKGRSGPHTHARVKMEHPYRPNESVVTTVPLAQIVRTWEEQKGVDRRRKDAEEKRHQQRQAAEARRDELNQRLQALGLDFVVRLNWGGYPALMSVSDGDGFEAAEELIRRVTKGEEK